MPVLRPSTGCPAADAAILVRGLVGGVVVLLAAIDRLLQAPGDLEMGRPRKARRGQRPPTCGHDWVVVERHFLAGLAHRLQRCRRCASERLVRASDGNVVA